MKLNEVAKETAFRFSLLIPPKHPERFYRATLRHTPEGSNLPKERNITHMVTNTTALVGIFAKIKKKFFLFLFFH